MAKKNYRPAKFLLGSDAEINASSSHEYILQYEKFGSYSLPKHRRQSDSERKALGIGSFVRHEEYGVGQITRMSRGKIKVVFERNGKEAFFVYPFVFEKGILSKSE